MQLVDMYHLDHARACFRRLAQGPVTARQKFADGLAATVGEAVALFEPLPGEARLLADGVMPRTSEDLLAHWLEALGQDLEAVSLDFVLEHHGPGTGEMVPTSSGEIAGGEGDLGVPGVLRRDGLWVHEGGFTGGGGRRGRHSEDFVPLREGVTGLDRADPGANW